jgi:Tfp pilus assembly protein PilX
MTQPTNPTGSQQGVATLTVSLTLLTAITLLSIAFAHSEMMEQRITNNQLRASEAAQAAEAGLAFGRAWLSRYRARWRDTGTATQSSIPDSDAPRIQGNHGDTFVIGVTFQRTALQPYYVKIRADARARSEPGLIASTEAYVRPQTVLSQTGEASPPLVIDGCIPVVTGTPDIYPRHADSADATVAIASSGNGGCLNLDALDLHGGDAQIQAFLPGQAWEYVFRISKSEMKALADAEQGANLPTTQRSYWWATTTDLVGRTWTRSLGSPDNPVVLVVPAHMDCPRLGAGTVIYGVVFVEGGCEGTADWGSARIYGALVIEGTLGQLSPKLRLAHISVASINHEELLLPLIGAPMVPGTWKDF